MFNNVDDSPANAPTEQKLENVMLNWGMSRREAENALRRPSSICLLLERGDQKVGILYIDTDRPNAFPDAEPELQNFRATANADLAASLDEILDELSSLRLGLDLRI